MPRLQLIIVQVVGTMLILLACTRLIGAGNPLLAMMIIAAAPILILLFKPQWLIMAAIATFASSVRAPGLIATLELHHVLAALLPGVVGLRMLMLRTPQAKTCAPQRWCLLFGAILFVVMLVRGVGFRFLGSNLMGGVRYVALASAIVLYLLTPRVPVSKRVVMTALAMLCLAALIPFIVQILYIASEGELYQPLYFVIPKQIAPVDVMAGEAIQRLQSGNTSSMYLLLLPFLLFPMQPRYRATYVLLIMTSMLIAAFSGHRLTMIVNGLFLLTCGYLLAHRKRVHFVLLIGGIGLATACFLMAFSNKLPLPFQRAISWVPGIAVDPIAMESAQNTIQWRLNVWRNALSEIPNYLWMGKGYAYDGDALRSLSVQRHYTQYWPSIQVAYHNGPLSLLIGMGIPGLVVGLALLLSMLNRARRLAGSAWRDADLYRIHHVLSAWLVVNIFTFLFLYGDVHISLPGILLTGTLMEVARRTDEDIANVNGPETPESENPAHVQPSCTSSSTQAPSA